jgi:cytochrome c556
MEKVQVKYDVAGLEALVVSISAAASVVDAVLADGKVDFKDLPKLPALLGVLRTMAKVSWKDLPQEASDVDAAEAAKLADLFKREFNITSDSVEETVEQGFNIVLQLLSSLGSIMDVVRAVLPKKSA